MRRIAVALAIPALLLSVFAGPAPSATADPGSSTSSTPPPPMHPPKCC